MSVSKGIVLVFSLNLAVHCFAASSANAVPSVEEVTGPVEGTELRDARALLAIQIGDTSRQLALLKEGVLSLQMDLPELQRRFSEVVQQTSQLNAILNVVVDSLGSLVSSSLSSVSVGGVGLGFLGGAVAFGLKEAVQAIHEAITHEKRDRALLLAFDNAMAKYREARKWIQTTEAEVDSHLYLLNLMQAAGGRTAFLRQVRGLIWDQQAQIATLKEIVAFARKTEHLDLQFIRSMEALGTDLQALLKKTESLEGRVDGISEEGACVVLKEGMRMVFDGEAMLQDQRIPLLDSTGERVWFEAWDKTYRAQLKALSGTGPHTQVERLKEEAKLIEKNYDEQIKADLELYRAVRKAQKKCLSDLTGIPMVFSFVALPSQKSKCWEEAIRPMSPYADPYLEKISDLDRLRANLLFSLEMRRPELEKLGSMRPSAKYYEYAINRYRRFFDQLAFEQERSFIERRLQRLEGKQMQVMKACAAPHPS